MKTLQLQKLHCKIPCWFYIPIKRTFKKWRKLEEFYTWIDLFIINLFCKSEVERLIRIIATILTWDSKSVLEISQTSTQFFNVKSSSRVVIDKEDFLRCKTVEVESHFCHSLKLGVEMPKCIWEVKHCFVLTDSSWLRKISIFACSRYFFDIKMTCPGAKFKMCLEP